mmetsp:Transcript_69697/g.181325  ORF Transcript_69697/g.181325 Transcript_69697/m.181325 type:complete len:205 (-) Transcript_69697:227-841(-)
MPLGRGAPQEEPPACRRGVASCTPPSPGAAPVGAAPGTSWPGCHKAPWHLAWPRRPLPAKKTTRRRPPFCEAAACLRQPRQPCAWCRPRPWPWPWPSSCRRRLRRPPRPRRRPRRRRWRCRRPRNRCRRCFRRCRQNRRRAGLLRGRRLRRRRGRRPPPKGASAGRHQCRRRHRRRQGGREAEGRSSGRCPESHKRYGSRGNPC